MTKNRSLPYKYELPVFFLLAFLLSWWTAPFINGGLLPHGPALAAVITVLLFQGRQGLIAFWRRLWNWRAGWWYLIGPAIIFGYQGVALFINLLAGAEMAQSPQIPQPATWLQLILLGGMWEEIGWSGYALPKIHAHFQNRKHSLLIAGLVLGIFRAAWHLPLFLAGTIYWFDILIFEFGFQLLIAWIYFSSNGSVPAVMVFHFFSNIIGATLSPVFTGADRARYYAIFMALATAAGFLLTLFARPKGAPTAGTPSALQ